MRMPSYPAGVPTPYSMHVHPYPTRFHGPIYTRPVFGFPVIARPQQVFTPGYDIDRGAPQPPISGLGEVNSSWNTGDGVFRPGGYGGGVFDGDISGLGALGRGKPRRGLRGLGDDSATYPWRTYSDATKQLQEATNVSLAKAGLCPIAADGKLGGGTCGARNHLSVNSEKYFGQLMAFNNPSECDKHAGELVRPQPQSSGCGSGGGGGSMTTLPSSTLPPLESGMSSSTKRVLGFALGGALAIGAVVMLRKGR